MSPDVLNDTVIEKLRDGLAGRVIVPTDLSYGRACSVFNAVIDRRPALIAQCENAEDVAKAIRFGRDHSLEIAVRGGGHSVAGMALADGGLVIDLRRMNTVTVDPEARTATVAGGATMSDLDRATAPHDLATTGGRVSTMGVGGFTLGGGSGWLERKFGLACDNLLAVELVTAAGRRVQASEGENPELFWALHGGGGNFGVATSFTFRLHPLGSVTAALLLWRSDRGPEVARVYRDFMESAPDEVGGGLLYLTGPPDGFVPEHLVGMLACGVMLTYAGAEHEARQVIEPMLALEHDSEVIVEVPYAELQCMLDVPPGYRSYSSAEHLDDFPDSAVDLFCRRAEDMIVPSSSQHLLLPLGGAIARGRTDYPIPWRQASWTVHPLGIWEDPVDDERAEQWACDLRADMTPWSTGAVYLNFIGDEGANRVLAGFGAENCKRLAAVKAEFDPDNVFHLNHNIRPA